MITIKMKLRLLRIMGGLAGINLDYIKAMDYWFKNNREGTEENKFAADVINVHEYFGQNAPEKTSFKKDLIELVDYVKTNLSDEKEVWLTEFGYDSYTDSNGNRSKNSASSEQEQANWLVRANLIAASTGINRAFMFQGTDPGEESPNLFQSSGLVGNKRSYYARKPSYYYTYATKNILTGYTFEEVIDETDTINVYKFVDTTNKKSIYALWATEDTKEYALKLENTDKNMTKIELQDYSTNGVRTSIKQEDLVLNLSETPIFIEVSTEQEVMPPTAKNAARTDIGKNQRDPGTYTSDVEVELSTKERQFITQQTDLFQV